MSQIKKDYSSLLKEVCGRNWKNEKSYRVGNAGIALTVSFLHNRSLKIQDLVKNVPDFSQTEIKMALKNLMLNKFFEKDKDNKYVLSVDKDSGLESIIFWALLSNVAQGFIKRVNN